MFDTVKTSKGTAVVVKCHVDQSQCAFVLALPDDCVLVGSTLNGTSVVLTLVEFQDLLEQGAGVLERAQAIAGEQVVIGEEMLATA
jgi:hypothetical protein